MSYFEMNAAVADEHVRMLQAAAAERRLARLANCCRPSYLATRLGGLIDRLVHRNTIAGCCS